MSDTAKDWPSVWRQWLQARFGGELHGDRLEAAVAECEAFRALWGPLNDLASLPPGPDEPHTLDNGELPFVHLLPPAE